MSIVQTGLFAELPPPARKAFFALALTAICLLFAFPIIWLLLTSLRPQSGVYYVWKGTEFTLGSYLEVLANERIRRAFFNSGLLATAATVLSIQTTGWSLAASSASGRRA